MGKPTTEELAKINRFTMMPVSEDEVFVFKDMMIDDQITSYYSIIHENLLNKFLMDTMNGVGLLLNHNQNTLPVGKSFDGELVTEYIDGKLVKSLYGKFYIRLGRNTEHGVTTDDIVKGIEDGTISDTSIGFSANSWVCSICGNDIRDFMSCPHIPGEKYVIERNNQDIVETCCVIIGKDGEGELLENSLVFAGACNRASIIKEFTDNKSVTEFSKGTKLTVVDSFKNIPLNAKIYQFYSKDGVVFFTDTEERTNGLLYLKQRSEEIVTLEKFKEILGQYGITFESEEEFVNVIQTLKAELESKKEEILSLTQEKEQLQQELANTTIEIEELKTTLRQKDDTIKQLEELNGELSVKAGIAETYRQDLINKCLELGVRVQGNAFNKQLFEKFLNTLSIDEIKETVKGFEEEVKIRFSGARVTEPQDRSLETRKAEVMSKDDFETEEEFRAYVAEKAIEYAKENGISIAEATKLIYKKYSQEDGSEE